MVRCPRLPRRLASGDRQDYLMQRMVETVCSSRLERAAHETNWVTFVLDVLVDQVGQRHSRAEKVGAGREKENG